MAGFPVQSDKLDEISQSIPIPEFKIGWIIGKKGSYIVQLAQKSGAAITVSEGTSKEFGIVWKYVQVSGSRRAVDRAKKLLHIRLERFRPRDEMGMEPSSLDRKMGFSEGNMFTDMDPTSELGADLDDI